MRLLFFYFIFLREAAVAIAIMKIVSYVIVKGVKMFIQ